MIKTILPNRTKSYSRMSKRLQNISIKKCNKKIKKLCPFIVRQINRLETTFKKLQRRRTR